MKTKKLNLLNLFSFFIGILSVLNIQAQSKPNIIIVYTDDISARELPIYGSDTWTQPDSSNSTDPQYRAQTPVLDKMATEGCYIETAWAATICSPSRAMMMTGRYAHLHKWWVNGDIGTYLDPTDNKTKKIPLYVSSPKTIGHIAKEGGYDTFWAGKTQMGNADITKFAFDEAVFTAGGDGLNGRSPNTDFGLQRVNGSLVNLDSGNAPDTGDTSTYAQNSWYWKTSASTMKKNASGGFDFAWWNDNENGTPTDVNTYGPDVELDFIFDFMERKTGENKPFFIYHTSHLGHDAFDYITDGNVSKWPGTPKVTWNGTEYTRTTPNITGSNGVYNTNNSITDSGIHNHVNYLDYQMSLYLEKLKALGIENNTLIIFTSDNGTSGFGKANSSSQRGTHVPFIVYGPGLGITKTGKQDVLLNMSDVLPTIAEVAGVEIPCDYKINGESFWPFLTTAKTTHRDWIYGYQGNKQIIRNQKVMIDGNDQIFDVRTPASDLTSFTSLANGLPTTLSNPELEASKNELISIMTPFDLHATQRNGLPDASVNGMGCITDTDDIQLTFNSAATTIGTDGTLETPINFTLTNITNGTINNINVRVYSENEDPTLENYISQFQINGIVDVNSNTADSSNNIYTTTTQTDTPKVGSITREYTINTIDLLAGKTITEGDNYIVVLRVEEGGVSGSNPLSHYIDSGVQPTTGTGSTSNLVFPLNTLKANCVGTACTSSEISVTFNSTATAIKTDGTLVTPIIYTIAGIADNTTNAINLRLYPEAEDVTKGAHVAQFNNPLVNINSNTADSNNSDYSVTTQLNTPSVGFITKTYTINKIPLRTGNTINIGSKYVVALRFVQGSSLPFSTTEGVQKTTGTGSVNNVVMKFNELTGTDILSHRNIDKIDISLSITYSPLTSTLYINPNVKTKTYKVISLLGQTIKEVEANGTLDISDLNAGIYLLVTDVGHAKFIK